MGQQDSAAPEPERGHRVLGSHGHVAYPGRTIALYSYTIESGKDTAATFIQDWATEHGFTTSRQGFADVMKIVCADALGVQGTDEDKIAVMDDLKFVGEVQTYLRNECVGVRDGRDFIVGLAGDTSGQYGIRRWDQDFWVRQARLTGHPPNHIHLITDARFFPECSALMSANALIFEIERPGTRHVNEDRWDYALIHEIIPNIGTLDDLRESIESVMDTIYTLDP